MFYISSSVFLKPKERMRSNKNYLSEFGLEIWGATYEFSGRLLEAFYLLLIAFSLLIYSVAFFVLVSVDVPYANYIKRKDETLQANTIWEEEKTSCVSHVHIKAHCPLLGLHLIHGDISELLYFCFFFFLFCFVTFPQLFSSLEKSHGEMITSYFCNFYANTTIVLVPLFWMYPCWFLKILTSTLMHVNIFFHSPLSEDLLTMFWTTYERRTTKWEGSFNHMIGLV